MKKKEKAKILSEAEFNQLLTVTKVGKFAIRNVAILYCSFGLGLPAKEIASLTIDDVADAQYELLDKICLYRKHKKQYYLYLTNKKVHNALADHLMNMKNMGARNRFFKHNEGKSLGLMCYKNCFENSTMMQGSLMQVHTLVVEHLLPD